MKSCSNCGKKIKNKINYCSYCGARQGNSKWKKPIIFLAILCVGIVGSLFIIVFKTKKDKSVSIVVDSEINQAYTANPENFALDEESGITYVNNILLVFFKKTATIEEKKALVHDVGGTIVGQFDMIDQYQIQIEPRSLDEIEDLCSELEQKEFVDCVTYDLVMKLDSDAITIPDDKWTNGWFQKEEWNEENPNGNNWWMEAIQAPSAWKYQDKFTSIKIGIVDDGFDSGHEDLELTVLNNNFNKKLKHGTHVAGIVGATANNKKGITGVLWNKELVCYAWDQYDEDVAGMTQTSIIVGLFEVVEHGGKVVNFSAGMEEVATHTENRPQYVIDAWGEKFSIYVASLLSRKFDFLIVMSAGNGAADEIGVDAKNSGLFASITYDNCVEIDGVSKADILDRIIIVGACQKPDENGNYILTSYSNYGEQVDIVAPGDYIYSTVPGGFGGKYDSLSGTSMAAPMVTGVAGMVWSLNKNLDGPAVKRIVCKNYDKLVKENPVAALDGRTELEYPLLNAKLAVEAVLGELEGNAVPSVPDTEINDDEMIEVQESYAKQYYDKLVEEYGLANDSIQATYINTNKGSEGSSDVCSLSNGEDAGIIFSEIKDFDNDGEDDIFVITLEERDENIYISEVLIAINTDGSIKLPLHVESFNIGVEEKMNYFFGIHENYFIKMEQHDHSGDWGNKDSCYYPVIAENTSWHVASIQVTDLSNWNDYGGFLLHVNKNAFWIGDQDGIRYQLQTPSEPYYSVYARGTNTDDDYSSKFDSEEECCSYINGEMIEWIDGVELMAVSWEQRWSELFFLEESDSSKFTSLIIESSPSIQISDTETTGVISIAGKYQLVSGEKGGVEIHNGVNEDEAYKKVEDYWLGWHSWMPENVECTETEEGYEFWGYYDAGDHAATNFRILVTKKEGRMYDLIWDCEISD